MSSPFDAVARGLPSTRSSGERGSLGRAKQRHHAGSDLEVAIEIDPVGNDEDVQTSSIAEANRWTDGLDLAVGLSVDLNHHDREDVHSKVVGYVDDNGVLVFERSGSR